MRKPVRAARTYHVAELKAWMQLSRSDVDNGQYPADALPWKYVRIVAMHHKHDRRNTDEIVWLDTHVRLHAREAGGLPAVSPGVVPVDDVVARFKKGDSPAEIAAACKLDGPALVGALRWAQKTATTAGAWRKAKIASLGPTAKKAPDLHGKALVESVIASAKERGFRASGKLTASEIGKLRLAHGRPLPPSLATWLAYDSSKLHGGKKLVATNLAGVIAAMGERFSWARLEKQLTGPCYLLDVGDRQATFLYAESADPADGEYPVVTLDIDGEPEATVIAPGFDLYIAVMTGYFEAPAVLGTVAKAYQARLKAQTKRVFGGR